MNDRFLLVLSILLYCNIYSAPLDLTPEPTALNEATKREKEIVDVNQINSSVDAGSFFSVDSSIKQLEENMLKMAQELRRLKQHVELAKQIEQKQAVHVQKLERENAKLCSSWLDNSWTGSSDGLGRDSAQKTSELKPDSATTHTLAQAPQSQASPVLHGVEVRVVSDVCD